MYIVDGPLAGKHSDTGLIVQRQGFRTRNLLHRKVGESLVYAGATAWVDTSPRWGGVPQRKLVLYPATPLTPNEAKFAR